MDTTPKSKTANRRIHLEKELLSARASSPLRVFNTPSLSTTPKNQKTFHLEDSPIFFGTSQELNEEVDVLWDWQSPHSTQTNEKRRKTLKRAMQVDSPKFPVKKTIQASQNFDKFHQELKALRAQLAQPDDEDSLCISPQQERELKMDNSFFNDSLDEELLQFSQAMEKNAGGGKNPSDLEGWNKSELVSQFFEMEEDDLFDQMLETVDLDKLVPTATIKSPDTIQTTQPLPIKPDALTKEQMAIIEKNRAEALSRLAASKKRREQALQKPGALFFRNRTVSDNNINVNQPVTGKLEFQRTKSFEINAIKEQNPYVLKSTQEREIERKRQEVMAKQRNDLYKSKETVTKPAPMQCTSEEIEKKRQEALAKLAAKRLENNIEIKRQEALKRLEMNRLRSVGGNVKSSLSKRF